LLFVLPQNLVCVSSANDGISNDAHLFDCLNDADDAATVVDDIASILADYLIGLS